ncbi:MAG: TolC family protein [Acidobacteriota bacterium]
MLCCAVAHSAAATAPQTQPKAVRITLAEALRLTLEQNQQIRSERGRVAIYQGAAIQAQGAFDLQLSASANGRHTETPIYVHAGKTPVLFTEERDEVASALEVRQLLPSGITLSPAIQLDRTSDNTGQTVRQTAYTGGLSVDVPLLRGSGSRAVTAPARSAWNMEQSARSSLSATIAQQCLTTIIYYWECLAAERMLAIMQESEQRAYRYLDLTRSLIEGYVQPASMLQQAQATVNQAVADRIMYENSYSTSVESLTSALGWLVSADHAVPLPAEDFPDLKGFAPPAPGSYQQLVDIAFKNRPDLEAARQNEEASIILLDAYKNNLRPQLDLTLVGGVAGTDDSSYFGALVSNLKGPSFTGNLSFQWPVQNRSAIGQLTTQQGAVEQAKASNEQARISAASAVLADSAVLDRALTELSRRVEAVGLYRQSEQNLEEQFKLGMATMVDLTLIQDKLASAQLNEINARLAVMIDIAQIHYDMGTLVLSTPDGPKIREIYSPSAGVIWPVAPGGETQP